MSRLSARHLPIAGLLATALFLRLFPQPLPLMYDEISTIIRLQFDDFQQLIEKGVKEDVHPAGVQVFLYYWTQLFGVSAWAVKLPFIAMSVGSVWLTHKVSMRLFGNEMGALLAAACMACLQSPVMYGQICRLYASGAFLSLWATAVLLAWHSQDEGGRQRNLAYMCLWGLCLSLNAYNHHFSMLFSGILWASAWLLMPAKQWKYLLGAAVLAVLLYLPHLPITLHQLSQKGLDWLTPPRPDFFVEYLNYIFHFSVWVKGTVLSLVVWGLFEAYRHKTFTLHWKARLWLMLLFGVLPIIGYLYSVWRAPVLQYSMLLFVLPYFFIWLFSFYARPHRQRVRLLILGGLCGMMIASLVWERRHYDLFNRQALQQLPLVYDQLKRDLPEPITAIFNAKPAYIGYYDQLYKRKQDYHLISEEGLADFDSLRSFLSKQTTPYLLTGNLPHELNQVIQEVYPCRKHVYEGFTLDMWLYSKAKCSEKTYWEEGVAALQTQSRQLYDLDLSQHCPDRHCMAEISLNYQAHSPVQVVLRIMQSQKILDKRVYTYPAFPKPVSQYISVRLTDIFLHKLPADCKLILDIQSDTPIDILKSEIRILPSNPLIYGLYEEL